MIKAAVISVGLVLAMSGCSDDDYVRACGTMNTNPPVARPMVECEKNGAGVRYFTTHRNNLEEDDTPVIGEPLDDDFYGSWVAPSRATKAPSVKAVPPKAPSSARPAVPRAAAPAPKVVAPAAPKPVAPAPRISTPTVRTGK